MPFSRELWIVMELTGLGLIGIGALVIVDAFKRRYGE